MAPARRTTVGEWLQYGAVLLVYGLLNVIPHRLARYLGAWAGLAVYGWDRRHRRLVQAQLRTAFPDWPAARIGRVAAQCYANLGRSAAEFARLGRADRETILGRVTVEGLEHLERARRQGRGVLCLGAHLGNWELLGIVCALLGHRLYPVVRPLHNPRLDRLVNGIRGRHGSAIVSKRADTAPRDMIQALRRGECVGILLDQNTARHQGLFVPFFGRPACTAKGLALMARRTGAPVVPMFIARVGSSDRHRVTIQPAIDWTRGPTIEEELVVNTARCTAAIERMVRAHPEQWLWMHRRWRTQPEAPPSSELPVPALPAGALRPGSG
ncbi:MAG: lysophospholipid acyltransferase family protein [Nitrospirota bacterium]